MRARGDLFNYFQITDRNVATCYLLSKIHKRLHNAPVILVIWSPVFWWKKSLVISSLSFSTYSSESEFIDKRYEIFLGKIKNLGRLSEKAIFCAIKVAGLYPNILHEEVLAPPKTSLDARNEKNMTTETVLKNNIFQFYQKNFKQLRATEIATTFTAPYAIIFMPDL